MSSDTTKDLERKVRILEQEIKTYRQAQDYLLESRELCTKLIDTIPDVIIRTDLEGKILFVNHHTFKISGYSWKQIEGQSILMFATPEDRDRMTQNIRLMQEQTVGPQEYTMIMKDQTRIPFEVHSDVLRGEDGAPFGLVSVCIDQRGRRRAEDTHHYQGKIQGVLEMAGSICHEMNQPIQSISGFVELLLLNLSENDPNRQHVESIKKQVEKMASITKQLLTIQDYKTQDYPGGKQIIDLDKTFR